MQHWDKSGAVMKLSDVLCESGPESRHSREDGARSPRHAASRGLSLTLFRSPGPGNVQIRDGDFRRKRVAEKSEVLMLHCYSEKMSG